MSIDIIRQIEDLEYLKEFISLIAEDIQEDIFDYLPEFAGDAEKKARNMWDEVKEICGVE